MLTTVRQAINLLGPGHRRRWVGLVFLAVVSSGFEMLGAILIYVLLALVADPGGEIELPVVGDVRAWAGDINEDTLVLGLIIAMGAFFLIRAAVQVGTAYIQSRVAHNAGARLSKRLVAGYLGSPYAVHLRRNSSELIRNSHQATQELVRQIFLPIIRVIAEALVALGLLVVMATIAPFALAMAVLGIGVAATLLLLFIQPRLKRIGRIAHETQRQTLAVLQEALHGIRDLKILGRERWFSREYSRSRLELARANYIRSTLSQLPHSVIETALIGFILVFFAFTITVGDGSEGTLSTLGLFAYVSIRIRPGIQQIIKGLNDLRFSAAPIGDLDSDLREIVSLPQEEKTLRPISFEVALVVEDVSFRYEQTSRDALSHVSMMIRPGEQIGICGPTGGGKTTLVDIVSGLLEPTDGRVTVDGEDLREHTRAWQSNLGVVPQMVFLLDGSLRSNIALGLDESDVDQEALRGAIALAQLTEFVDSLPDGLDTTVGERGIRVSGGQRQRIAIARALYRRPAILIFDEGTSSLDNTTEAELMAAIERLRGDHTIIVVAHRLSTVRQSDRVLFIEGGKVTGEGTYQELVNNHASFRMMAGTAQTGV